MAIITISPDRFGGALVRFKSERLHRKAVNAMQCQSESDRGLLLQSGAYIHNVSEETLFSRRAHRDLDEGWTVNVRMDAWDAAHFYGWDAHVAWEGGR